MIDSHYLRCFQSRCNALQPRHHCIKCCRHDGSVFDTTILSTVIKKLMRLSDLQHPIAAARGVQSACV